MRDVIVVGAGVAGLGAAWLLARAGLDVLVVERDRPGAGASTAAAGMLAPTAEVRWEEEELLALGRQSMALWPDFVAELEAASDINVDYRTEGTLVIALDRDDFEAIDHLHSYHQELKLDVQRLSAEAMREREPGLSPNTSGGLYIPGDHQVDPPLLVAALTEAFERAGGELRVGEVTEVSQIHDGFLVRAGEDAWSTRKAIMSPGAWLRGVGGLPDAPKIRPVKGQMLSMELGQPPLCTHVLRAPDAYLVPKTSGRLVVGATMEEMGFDDRMTAGGMFELLRGAWETLPGVYDQAIIDTWTGFRPMSLSNHPIVTESAWRGLFYSTGHGRNGILLTPWTAKTLCDLIL
ncbi:MAG: glycine oxidase ThiO [bacterium]